MSSATLVGRVSRSHLLLLGLILALAAAVRVYSLSTLGFWTDELCSLSEATGHGLELGGGPTDQVLPPRPVCTRLADARPAWAIVPNLARQDTHPPLYFLLLRAWMAAFGDGEAAVRSLDVCCSVAAIALLYAAAAPDVGSTTALWACLIMAVASPQVQFAQEARDYMPAVTLSLAAAVAARRLPSRGATVALGTCLLLLMLTNYLAAPVAAVIAGSAMVRRSTRRSAVLATSVAAVVYLAVWGWAVPMQWRSAAGETAWLTDTVPGHAGRAWLSLARLPVRWVADVDGRFVAVGGLLFLALPWAIVVKPTRTWALWVAVPMAVVAVGDLARHTTQATLLRYTLLATPGAYVLLAAAGRRTGWAVPAAAVVAGLLALPSAYAPPFKTDFKDPVQAVGRQLPDPSDGLVISGPNLITARIALAAAEHYLPTMPPTVVLLTRPADGPTLARLAACPRVGVLWLWPDRPIDAFLHGYRSADAGDVPHFGAVAVGRVVRPTAIRPQ